MTLVSYKKIKKTFKDVTVLKDVNLEIKTNDKIGLVGKNGAGKTTLANIICGLVTPDQGKTMEFRDTIRIGYLQQSTSYILKTFDKMIDDEDVRAVMGDFLEITSHLGLEGLKEWTPDRFSGLSGGEKTKLALASVWKTQPDLLVLDEPTNHMDYQSTEWLISQIKRYQGAIMIISHDRYFLDRTVTQIAELEEGVIKCYHGNYSFYREEKKRQFNQQQHHYITQKKSEAKIEQEMDRIKQWSAKAHRESRNTEMKFGGKEHNRVKAKKMDKRIKSKIKRLEKIKEEGIEKPKEEDKVFFEFQDPEKRGKRILEADMITKGYNKGYLFKDSSFYIKYGERIGIIGPNGCGKTTLLRLIMGKESLDEGELWVSPSIDCSYLSQDVMDLDQSKGPLEFLNATFGENRTRASTLLANMAFDEAMMCKPIEKLSLGERIRIKLADLILQEKSCLILDEPTNHLDLKSREQLEKTLDAYGGTMMIVSHDRYLLEKLCDRLLIFEDKTIKRVETDFETYMTSLTQGNGEIENHHNKITERKMIIENRMAFILGELNGLSSDDPKYQKLDYEFKTLAKEKCTLEE